MIQFTLYSRSYCHLCDDMLEQLQAYSPEYGFTVNVVDIDKDDELLATYDELVPVLVGQKEAQNQQRICHYYLDPAALKAFFHA
ncbi:glutaredoxin family protein [Undibacterium sp. TJN19]|uniref:glutaredoxin family protein n=1 Tax=Undibacterium sp. TJN19 TaxID=3413055 RepID=UPI003BF1ED69